jgi:hypothetical protein
MTLGLAGIADGSGHIEERVGFDEGSGEGLGDRFPRPGPVLLAIKAGVPGKPQP